MEYPGPGSNSRLEARGVDNTARRDDGLRGHKTRGSGLSRRYTSDRQGSRDC